MRIVVVVLLTCLLGLATAVLAQGVSLVDMLQAKGVINEKEAQELRQKGISGGTNYDQQALIGLLQKKGILEEKDLAQLQPAPVSAPTPPEVTQWLSHLESKQLETQAQVEEMRKTAVADVKKDIDWLNRFTLFGDIRVRDEGFYQDGSPARNRQRFRLRVGARLKVSDELEGGIRLASGDPNEIIANNQTMTDVFTRKPINIDNAYITVRPGQSIGLAKAFFSITGGKFSVNFFRPRAIMMSEMVYDEDLSPEGFAQEVTLFEGKDWLRSVKLATGQWAAKEFTVGADAYMLGEQLQVAMAPTPISQLTLAASNYYFLNSEFIAQERNRNSALVLTNSVVLRNGQVVRGGDLIVPNPQNPVQRFAGGFNVFDFSGQLSINTGYPRWPISLIFDYAHNFQAVFGNDNAYLFGAGIGQTLNPGDWAFSGLWTRVETDSVISMFTLSDYGRRGGTNVEGPIAKIDYMLMPRLTLTAKGYFVNFIDRPKELTNSMVNRLQFDALLAF
jgi:hypothetical protein